MTIASDKESYTDERTIDQDKHITDAKCLNGNDRLIPTLNKDTFHTLFFIFIFSSPEPKAHG